MDFDDRSRPKTAEGKNKRNSYERAYALYEGRKLIFNAFRSGNFEFPIKKQGKGFKITTPKQELQRLAIALPQVKAGKTPENLLNDIRQIMFSLYRAKNLRKKYITIFWIQ